MPENQLKQ